MAHGIQKELQFIFLHHHRTVTSKRSSVTSKRSSRSVADDENPFDQSIVKAEFGKTAHALHDELNGQRNDDNSDNINEILIELYAIGYMLNNQITLKSQRILDYNQQLKQLDHSHYGEVHKLLVQMENETARAVNNQEQLDSVIKRIQTMKSHIEGLKETIRTGEALKEVGLEVLIAGCLGGLFVAAIGAFTGNLSLVAAGIAALIAAPIVGAALNFVGTLTVKEVKKTLEEWQKILEDLERQKEDLQKAIDEDSKELIRKEEEKAKKRLGIDQPH